MKTVLYRRWAPPQSPIRIEFLSDLIHDVRAQSRGDHDRGYLFGRRDGLEVRIVTAIRDPQAGDPRIDGLEAVGVFVLRVRGEVFLTEDDLEQAARVENGVVFVMAGARAGFFVREIDGSMQAVRSHEEFAIADAAPLAESPSLLVPPAPLPRGRHPAIPPQRWRWALAAAAALAIPVAALAYLRPASERAPIEVSLREAGGQLIIRWDPRETNVPDAHLDITGSEGRTILPIMPGAGSATYTAQSGDVEVVLTAGSRSGRVRWTSARFVPPVPAQSAEYRTPDQIREDMEQLQLQAAWLRGSIARRQAKVRELSAAADSLLAR